MNSNRTRHVSAGQFLKGLEQSQLLESVALGPLLDEWRAKLEAEPQLGAEAIASAFVAGELLTRWQADKLLQGKSRSFRLGKYRLLGLLGKGGMSTVYLAEHVVMKRRCALKVLPSRRVSDSSWLGRFHREAQAGAALDHPNIVRTYDVDQLVDGNNEVHFIVMEYVDGEDLRALVDRDGPLTPVLAADYSRQAADGLAHAHDAEIVHRDMKPGNLLLDADGTIRLMDLGLALGGEDEEESLTRAHNEKIIGTADYLSPEQALDSHLVDPRADLYGLGCTLYFLLTGRPPFNDGTLAQRILAHQSREPDSLTEVCPGISPELVAIIQRLMKKKPEDRYQTATEVSQALTRWLAENGTPQWIATHQALIEAVIERPIAKPVTPSAGDRTNAADSADVEIPVARPVAPASSPPHAEDFSELPDFTSASDAGTEPNFAAVTATVTQDEGASDIAAADSGVPAMGSDTTEIHAGTAAPDLSALDFASADSQQFPIATSVSDSQTLRKRKSNDAVLIGVAVIMLLGLIALIAALVFNGS